MPCVLPTQRFTRFHDALAERGESVHHSGSIHRAPHTVGPMRAAAALAIDEDAALSIVCELFGSLAPTGNGHATDTVIPLGLSGWLPTRLDPNAIPVLFAGRAEICGAACGRVAAAFADVRNAGLPIPDLYEEICAENSSTLIALRGSPPDDLLYARP